MLSKLRANQKQMRLKTEKKLRTAIHNSKYTSSYKKENKYMHFILFECR